MDRVIVSIGGSVLVPGNDDSKYIMDLAHMLSDVSEDVQVTVVCGGGKVSRYYVDVGKKLGGDDYQLDLMGIAVTRINAALLGVALGKKFAGSVPTEIEECARLSVPGKIAIMGGTEPGHTTDAVSAMLAESMCADRIVNASNVDAVYSDDPRKNPDAKRFSEMTIQELKDVVYDDHEAGKSSVFDPLGVKIAMESRIDLYMVNGRDLSELKNAILGKKIKGTFVNSH